MLEDSSTSVIAHLLTVPHQKPTPKRNGMIYALAKIMQNVISLAMEAEVGAAFLTAKEARDMRVSLKEMGHPQPPTLLMVENQTAVGFVNDQIKQRHFKAINMRFHWIKDCTRKGHFVVFWSPEKKKKTTLKTKNEFNNIYFSMYTLTIYDV